MDKNETSPVNSVLSGLDPLLPDLETTYKDIHANPELSMQEKRTAGIAADRLRTAGFEVTAGWEKRGSWDCFAMAMARP